MKGAAVFFLPSDVSSLLNGTTAEQRHLELSDALADLAPRLVADRREHLRFGPYWWWIKPLAAQVPGARRGWIRGGYRDRAIADAAPPELPAAAAADDRETTIAWLGLRYYEAELVDGLASAFHVIELPAGEPQVYTLYDADASRQLDLFAETDQPSAEVRHLMQDPARFSAAHWLIRADELEAEGRPWHAAAALRRAVERAVDDTDRSRAWLRLGQLFQTQGHIHKAIFCYRNAFDRDQEGWIQGLMGEAWMEAGDAHEALRCYRAALAAMPGNPEYQAGLNRAERAVAERHRNAVGYSLLQERLAR